MIDRDFLFSKWTQVKLNGATSPWSTRFQNDQNTYDIGKNPTSPATISEKHDSLRDIFSMPSNHGGKHRTILISSRKIPSSSLGSGSMITALPASYASNHCSRCARLQDPTDDKGFLFAYSSAGPAALSPGWRSLLPPAGVRESRDADHD